jgi:hypothetical protein
MPLKFWLDVMPEKVEQREVEIPDKCPRCGQDLHESCALSEVTFTVASCNVNLSEAGIDYGGSMETYPEAAYTIDYECTHCRTSVVGARISK